LKISTSSIATTGNLGQNMEIKINGQTLDVSLENEKTIGQILAELEKYITDSGHVLSGLNLDGHSISASQIEEIFSKEINSVKEIDIKTNPLSDIAASGLVTLLDDIKQFESLNFSEKPVFANNWKESACGLFINANMPDLFLFAVNSFSGGDMSPQMLYSITEERLREVKTPLEEFSKIEPILNEICEKLINLPLDIQTGKDIKASQTIQIFTAVAEKILRIYYQLDIQKYISANNEKILQQVNSFTDILKELLDAYTRSDSVLVGDLAEYEISVKIKELYTAILESCPANPDRGEK
jgi:hypothetical protein